MERLKLRWKTKTHKKWRALAFIVLVSFLVWRVLVWAVANNTNTQTAAVSFNAVVQNDIERLQHQLEVYSDSLYAGRALFGVDTSVSRQDWTNFVDAQNVPQRYPGLYAIAYVSVINDNQIGELTQQLNANRLPTEQTSITIFPASTDKSLAVATYIAPGSANQSGIGYNLYSNQARRQDLDTARDTGLPRASTPLSLISDKKGAPPSILLALPVYNTQETLTTATERQADLQGYVVLALQPRQLLDFIFKSPSAYGNNLAVSISTNGQVVYQTGAPPATQRLQKAVALDFAGQTWQLALGAPDDFGLSETAKLAPTLVLISAVPFALVLYIAFYYFLSVKVMRQPAPDTTELQHKDR